MIPLELTIEGLYSYQKRQTIDFTKLTSAGLFGIFGTVGSGKSSILEAITYAIYGRTDKLNQSGDNRNYNMMNLKSNELLIDFIFETGREQTKYKSTVKGRRNSKRFEDVKTFERRAFKKIEEEWVPIEIADLEKAVGLSYENFKRTIIIPQGQFQEFLQLGNRDRTQMMKELFNLQKYEFYYKVVSIETKNISQKQLIIGQLQQLGTLDHDKVNVYNKQLKELEDSIKEQNLKLIAFQKAEEQLRGLLDKIQKRDESQKILNNLIQQQPEFTKLENRITRYEQVVATFKHLLKSLNEYRANEKTRRKQILSDETKLKLDNESIDKLAKIVEELKSLYEKREELRRKADELNTIIKIKELEKAVKCEAKSVEDGNKYWEETNGVVVGLKKNKDILEKNLSELRASMPDFTLLTNIKAWYTEKHSLEKQINDIKDQLKICSDKQKELLTNKESILKDPIFNGATHLSFNECTQYLESETSKLNKLQSDLTEHESHVFVKSRLEAFAENLEDNTPCPLCGSLHHPELFKSEDLKALQLEIKNRRLTLDKQQQTVSSVSKQLSVLEISYNELKHRAKELEKENNKSVTNYNNHSQQFTWNKYNTYEELNSAFEEMKLIQNNIKTSEDELKQKVSYLNNNESKLERARLRLEELNKSLTIHKTQLHTLQQQLQTVSLHDYTECKEESIIEERNTLLKEYERIEKDYSLNVNLLKQKSQQRDTLNGQLAANIGELKKEQSSIEDLKKKINNELAKSNFISIEEVETILSDTIDVKVDKLRIEEFKNNLLTSKSTFEHHQNEVGDSKYDSETHIQLKKEIVEIKTQVDQMNEDRGQMNEKYNRLIKNIETQLTLQTELKALETRSDYIKTMKSLFKASGFVNYISSVYLQNLCNAANSRFFQLTRQKLSLEICEDNNFRVRDYMNGGKQRSVKTLSGGQTFQASLSLALALADNIQKITESNQNFFFLDEGFGSLDKESLGVVFDTLKSLRKENRIIGVISHVEEMQQEIETHLHIENHEDKGSIIHPSWSNNY
ncbi:MAG: AAA family ATPase [Fermentimonas sp.]|nr:AAA family ATPase [Fermentimonas sp.]